MAISNCDNFVVCMKRHESGERLVWKQNMAPDWDHIFSCLLKTNFSIIIIIESMIILIPRVKSIYVLFNVIQKDLVLIRKTLVIMSDIIKSLSQGIQSVNSILAINLLKSGLFTFNTMCTYVHLLKCTKQNVNNKNLTQISQLYVYVSFCLKVIRSWLNLPTGGHGHVICMGVSWKLIFYYFYQTYATFFQVINSHVSTMDH